VQIITATEHVQTYVNVCVHICISLPHFTIRNTIRKLTIAWPMQGDNSKLLLQNSYLIIMVPLQLHKNIILKVFAALQVSSWTLDNLRQSVSANNMVESLYNKIHLPQNIQMDNSKMLQNLLKSCQLTLRWGYFNWALRQVVNLLTK